MLARFSRFLPGLVAGGALVMAITTGLEVLTAPYSAAVSAYPANGAVHAVKVAAIAAWITGMLGFWATLRSGLGRTGSVAVAVLVLGTALGAIPYSVVEATLSPSLSPTDANRQLDAVYAAHEWIGQLGMVGLPLVMLGVVTLAVVVLRRRVLARWAPIVSLAAIPVAVLAGVLGESTGLPIPHPPAWLFVGLATYGVALRQARTRTDRALVAS